MALILKVYNIFCYLKNFQRYFLYILIDVYFYKIWDL